MKKVMNVNYCHEICWSLAPGRGTRPKFGKGGVSTEPWNPDPVIVKKFVEIVENWYPVYDFQDKFHSFFVKIHDF